MCSYPVVLNLQNRAVLVVGGGKVAERKIDSLLESKAKVFLVSKDLTEHIKDLINEKKIVFLGKEFSDEHLNGKFIIIVATDDHSFNSYVADKARKRGILVNVVDQPSECDFFVPSVLRRGDLIISVSTSGKSPFLSKKIKEELALIYGIEYQILLEIFSVIRKILIRAKRDDSVKNEVYEFLYNSKIIDKIKEKDVEGIKEIFLQLSNIIR